MPYKNPKKRKSYHRNYMREYQKRERELLRKIRAMGYSTKVRTRRKKK